MSINIFNKLLTKIKNFKEEYFFIKNKKKINHLLKRFFNKKIHILDVGAGQRYLKSILNFEGISKVALIDPSENLKITKKNILKKTNDKDSINFFSFALSNKNGIQKFYPAKKSTGSSLIDFKKFKSKLDYDLDYFGELKSKKIKVITYKKFKLLHRWHKLDILKIDVEGYEKKIIKSIIDIDKPLIIQIELNFISSIYNESFNFVNNFLNKKNYKILTLVPVYQNNGEAFIKGDYENPTFRNQITQCDCFYIYTKSRFSMKNLTILIGFGFIKEAYKSYLLNKNRIYSSVIKKQLNLFFIEYLKIQMK